MSAEDCVGCRHINNCLGDCVGYEEVKPQEQTNEEWLRNCSTEELAKFIWNQYFGYPKTWWDLMFVCSRGVPREKQADRMIEVIVGWLREKHND